MLEKMLARILYAIANEWTKVVLQEILPAYKTDSNVMRAAIGASKQSVGQFVLGMESSIGDWLKQLELWHRRRFARNVLSVTGIDIELFLDSEGLIGQLEAVINRNMAFATGMADDLTKQVETIVWDSMVKKQPVKTAMARIAEKIGNTRRHAKFIAHDQSQKIVGDLDRLRQTQAGIRQYVWRHSHKHNFRPVHQNRDSKLFRWDRPPEDGHPRTQPNCGCMAQGYVGD